MLAGTLGALRALKNVARVSVYENDTNISAVDEDDNPYGLPAHSVTCVVEGGDDNDIAEAILYHKGIGCYTNGSTVVKVTDQNEYINTIRFYRPTYVPIYVHVKVKKYTGYISSLASSIKSAVYDYLEGLEIGRDVSISMLTGIVVGCNPNPSKPLFGISAITIGRSESALAAGDVDIDYNEVAAPLYDAIEVEV